jgi:hypothetical protein
MRKRWDADKPGPKRLKKARAQKGRNWQARASMICDGLSAKRKTYRPLPTVILLFSPPNKAKHYVGSFGPVVMANA